MTGFALIHDGKGRALIDTDSNQRPLRIEFDSAALRYRRSTTSARKDPLAKATRAGAAVQVIDCTAGLGKDAFMLTSFGCRVTMIERSPELGALLQDGLDRAADSAVADIVANMSLIQGDAIEYLRDLNALPDVIYMDPMFPPRTKHARVKGEMQLLQRFLGADQDIDALLEAACATGCKRVVVKRPLHGATLLRAPNYSLEGKTNRFDVFVNPTSGG